MLQEMEEKEAKSVNREKQQHELKMFVKIGC